MSTTAKPKQAPQFQMHQGHAGLKPKPDSHLDDLHTALRSCNEIGSARSLSSFLIDVQKMSGGRIPSGKHVAALKMDRAFAAFTEGVIVCTEQGYDDKLFEVIAQKEHKLDY